MDRMSINTILPLRFPAVIIFAVEKAIYIFVLMINNLSVTSIWYIYNRLKDIFIQFPNQVVNRRPHFVRVSGRGRTEKKVPVRSRGTKRNLHSSFSRFSVRRFSVAIHGRFSRCDKHTEMTRGRCFRGKKYTTRILLFSLSLCLPFASATPPGERNEKRTLDGHVDRSTRGEREKEQTRILRVTEVVAA